MVTLDVFSALFTDWLHAALTPQNMGTTSVIARKKFLLITAGLPDGYCARGDFANRARFVYPYDRINRNNAIPATAFPAR
jgi:hypothetical protein